MDVGSIEVVPLLDGMLENRIPATKALPTQASTAWQDQGGSFSHDGLLRSTVGGFLVRSGERVVLVDAGAGRDVPGGYVAPRMDPADPNDQLVDFFRDRGLADDALVGLTAGLSETRMTRGDLPRSLHAQGVGPDDITDVVLTHLHFDHIGWVSDGDRPFFPNATVHCPSADLEYFMGVPKDDWFQSNFFRVPLTKEKLAPVTERISPWDSDRMILPGINVRVASGHTPGSSVVVLASGHNQAMILGDVVHCPLELMDDDFNLLGDHDQELANKVRERYARELEDADTPAAGCHFPGLKFGRLFSSGDRVRRWSYSSSI